MMRTEASSVGWMSIRQEPSGERKRRIIMGSGVFDEFH